MSEGQDTILLVGSGGSSTYCMDMAHKAVAINKNALS